MTLRLHAAELVAQPDRVIAQVFLPREEPSTPDLRAAAITDRVLRLPAETAVQLAAQVTLDFGARHPDVLELLRGNADAVIARLAIPADMTEAHRLVLGAAFTAEYAVEGAALCNPSAVQHPDQTGLGTDQVRVAIALRAIGEGHRSSIGFAEAIIGPGRVWTFLKRERPLWRAQVDLEDASIAHVGPNPVYRAVFSPESALTQRVLTPVATEEQHGMEDARLVRFTDVTGATHYRATYTAYDGRDIAPRLIISPDLREFTIHRPTGDPARDKGMALFPRPVGGRYLALSRVGGESISLAESRDGVDWGHVGTVHSPTEPWEIVQTGNCGPPLETPRGWLVLVHGVGPMRRYALGALLLDLHDPTVVLGRTTAPILQPSGERRDGYVPNVVYSCGGLIADGVVWIPIGIGDARIGVCSIGVDELLARMVR